MAKKRGLEFYRDKKREWRWRVVAKNGKVLADSGEGYRRMKDCIAGAEAACVVIWRHFIKDYLE